jgi:hypothetical protein
MLQDKDKGQGVYLYTVTSALNQATSLRWVSGLSCVPWLRTLSPVQEGFCIVTYLAALELNPFWRWAPMLSRVT